MTPKRRAALRKAQAASARKRRGKGKGKLAAANRQVNRANRFRTAVKVGATAAAVGVAAYKARGLAGDLKRMRSNQIRSAARGRISSRREMRHAENIRNNAHAVASSIRAQHRANEQAISGALHHALHRPTSRRERAQAKLARSAAGTKGSRVFVAQRVFVAPARATRGSLRRARKLTEVAAYYSGAKNTGLRSIARSTRSRKPFAVSSSGRVRRSRRRRRK